MQVQGNRARLITALGGRCVWSGCGIDDPEMLQLDHINNDGTQKRGVPFDYYLRHLELAKTILQVLCANHNWKKRYHVEKRVPTGGAPPEMAPMEWQRQTRIQELTTWAATNQTVTSTISANFLVATSLIADQAMLQWSVSSPTARSYAHNVVVQLQTSLS